MIDHCSGNIKNHTSLVLHVDGGCEPCNPGGTATSGWVIYSSAKSKKPLAEAGEIAQDGGPLATNNYGEYSALCFALKWLVSQKWEGDLIVKADSKLLVEQVRGTWKCKASHLAVLRSVIWKYFDMLNLQIVTEDNPLPDPDRKSVTLHWIPREQNSYADALCHAAYEEHKKGKK